MTQRYLYGTYFFFGTTIVQNSSVIIIALELINHSVSIALDNYFPSSEREKIYLRSGIISSMKSFSGRLSPNWGG